MESLLAFPAVGGDAQIKRETRTPVTKTDFFLWGLSGGENSSEKRERLCRLLSFPPEMSANALLCAVNLLYSREESEMLAREL